MQESTPLGQPLLIQYNNILLNVCESGPNKINICFDELSQNLRHQIKDHELQKINYKTVVSSLKGQHPNILKAHLSKNADELYILVITVSYEFLPEITEEIIFGKREIGAEESEDIAVNNLKNYLRNLKEQIKSITNVQVLSGELGDYGNIHELYFPIPHPKVLIHWTLKFKNPSTTMLKAQLLYFNSITRKKLSSQFIPDEGVFMYYSGNECTVELRFLVEQSDKYDTVCLQINGKYQGSYIVSLQRVEIA